MYEFAEGVLLFPGVGTSIGAQIAGKVLEPVTSGCILFEQGCLSRWLRHHLFVMNRWLGR